MPQHISVAVRAMKSLLRFKSNWTKCMNCGKWLMTCTVPIHDRNNWLSSINCTTWVWAQKKLSMWYESVGMLHFLHWNYWCASCRYTSIESLLCHRVNEWMKMELEVWKTKHPIHITIVTYISSCLVRNLPQQIKTIAFRFVPQPERWCYRVIYCLWIAWISPQ